MWQSGRRQGALDSSFSARDCLQHPYKRLSTDFALANRQVAAVVLLAKRKKKKDSSWRWRIWHEARRCPVGGGAWWGAVRHRKLAYTLELIHAVNLQNINVTFIKQLV